MDIALVQMPHLVKRLELWSLRNGALERIAMADGFANHRLGSRFTGMSALADFDGDGVTDIALPGSDRRTIRFMSFADASPKQIGIVPLNSPADGDFLLKGKVVHVPLESGDVASVAYPG